MTPYLIFKDVAPALEWYARAFGAYPEWQSAETRGGSPVHLYLYVEDCDGLFQRALAAGAKELLPMADQDHGDRHGGLTDPFGHVWYVASRIRALDEH